MELIKTSLYSPDDLIALLKTSSAPLSKIAEETAIPEPTLKNYKYGKTAIDSMPYRIVVELSRFFRQYDLTVEKLKGYGHVVLPKDIDFDRFEHMFGNDFKENPHLYTLRVLHLFTSRYEKATICELMGDRYSFDHVFVVIPPNIMGLIRKTSYLSMSMNSMFELMFSLNITCVWHNPLFDALSRHFDNELGKYDSLELYEDSIKTERLMLEMKNQLFTNNDPLAELEYVDDVWSTVVIQYALMMFGIDPEAYYFYRNELHSRSRVEAGLVCEGLFTKKRVRAEYKCAPFKFDGSSVKELVDFKQFQLQMEVYRYFDLEISQKYHFDEILRKGTYEKLFE